MYCSAFSVIIQSITKLRKAMEHSSINVSLTYLRGLEVVELKEEECLSYKRKTLLSGGFLVFKIFILIYHFPIITLV
jgi:hypothetical protein